MSCTYQACLMAPELSHLPAGRPQRQLWPLHRDKPWPYDDSATLSTGNLIVSESPLLVDLYPLREGDSGISQLRVQCWALFGFLNGLTFSHREISCMN